MRMLVVYDSLYGNTEKIAMAIAEGINGANEVETVHVKKVDYEALGGVDLFIIGTPTHGGRPTPDIQAFVDRISREGLKNASFSTFDTRFSAKDSSAGMRLLMRMIGYAADKVAKKFENEHCHLISPAEGFFVVGKEGPLKEGELERAIKWGKTLGSRLLSMSKGTAESQIDEKE